MPKVKEKVTRPNKSVFQKSSFGFCDFCIAFLSTFLVLLHKSAFLSTFLSTFLSALTKEYFFEYFFECFFEHFFECSRQRVPF